MLDGRSLSAEVSTGSDLYGAADPDGRPQPGWFDQMMVQAVTAWGEAEGIDKFQAVLSAAGFIPVVGFAFNVVNAGIYAGRKMGAEATISAISMLPGLGDAAGIALTATRYGRGVNALVGTSAGAIARGVVNSAAQNAAEQIARVKFDKQDDFQWEQMAGAAVSGGLMGPLSVGIGGKMGASLSGGGTRAAYLAAGTGAAGLAGDAVTQWGAMSAGRQDGFNLGQSITAFAGGALGAALGQAVYDKTCFSGDTPMVARCEPGWKRADEVQANDYLASRDERDPTAPVVWNRVEEVFVAQGEIWELRWQDQTIRTTVEHPFYVHELGWTPARELKPGMLLATMDGRYLPLDSITSTGRTETVYNFRINEGHTYFVGKPNWDSSLWAHNTCKKATARTEGLARGGTYKLVDRETRTVVRTGRTNDLSRRKAEHNRDPELAMYQFVIDRRTDNRAARRGREQLLHDAYNPILNKIRPISEDNPNRAYYLREGRKI